MVPTSAGIARPCAHVTPPPPPHSRLDAHATGQQRGQGHLRHGALEGRSLKRGIVCLGSGGEMAQPLVPALALGSQAGPIRTMRAVVAVALAHSPCMPAGVRLACFVTSERWVAWSRGLYRKDSPEGPVDDRSYDRPFDQPVSRVKPDPTRPRKIGGVAAVAQAWPECAARRRRPCGT